MEPPSDSDHDTPDPRPPDVSRPPLSMVADDIDKITEAIPAFSSAFSRNDFLKLATKIHGGFSSSDSLAVTPIPIAPAFAVGASVSVDSLGSDGAVKGDGVCMETARVLGLTAGVAAETGMEGDRVLGGDGLDAGGAAHIGMEGARVLGGEGRAVVVEHGTTVGGRVSVVSVPPLPVVSKTAALQPTMPPAKPVLRFSSLRSTPDISKVRRLPVRGVVAGSDAAGEVPAGLGGLVQAGRDRDE